GRLQDADRSVGRTVRCGCRPAARQGGRSIPRPAISAFAASCARRKLVSLAPPDTRKDERIVAPRNRGRGPAPAVPRMNASTHPRRKNHDVLKEKSMPAQCNLAGHGHPASARISPCEGGDGGDPCPDKRRF